MDRNNKIAKNTLLLYFRMLLTMGISLYTSRIVLNTLGVVDFGIYNVIGGVVAMFTILSGSLSASVSRFLTFELGKGNIEHLKKVFSSSITIHIALAVFILILAELLGTWFLNNKMNIPEERLYAGNWVLHCSIFTFLINIISVPYNASIIAHEHMKAFAYVSILEAILKLIAVILLTIIEVDKLIIYAIMILAVAIIVRVVYGVYCKKKFIECTIQFSFDKKLLKEMTSFAGWNFIGASSTVLRDQGVNILLNLFKGPAINAARGISVQVNSAINNFVINFMTALNPQITKSYAVGDQKYLMNLIYQGARLSYYLLLLLSLPVIIETEQILIIWLKEVPEHTINFVRLILIFAMIECLSGPLITAMLATGKIRNYQIVVGGLNMLNFPLSYILLKLGLFPEVTLIVAIFISLICLLVRLRMLKIMIGLSIIHYIKKVIINITMVSLLSIIFPYLLYKTIADGIQHFLIIVPITIINTLIIIFVTGCTKNERKFILSRLRSFKN